MMSVLIAIRDCLMAMALAWVGVTVEAHAPREPACAGDTCESAAER